jgi:inosose dehydratase
MMNRREFLATGLAATVLHSAQGRVLARPLSGRTFRVAHVGNIWPDSVEEAIRECGRLGFEGIEPFRGSILKYVDRPQALAEVLDAAGVRMATCSNGGAPMADNFTDPSKVKETIAEHAKFARDFIAHFGCSHFKINLGPQREGGTIGDEQLRTMAKALNELGKRTAEVGVRLAPHPHLWSPFERQEEVDRVLELTDPRYVYLTADTAHLTLGGIDPVALLEKNYDRVAAIHWKDAPAKYRGHRGPTPSIAEHERVNLYKKLGTGGVDFVAFTKILRKKKFSGWVTLDFGKPRSGEGSVAYNVGHNVQYLNDVLDISL